MATSFKQQMTRFQSRLGLQFSWPLKARTLPFDTKNEQQKLTNTEMNDGQSKGWIADDQSRANIQRAALSILSPAVGQLVINILSTGSSIGESKFELWIREIHLPTTKGSSSISLENMIQDGWRGLKGDQLFIYRR